MINQVQNDNLSRLIMQVVGRKKDDVVFCESLPDAGGQKPSL
jgi:hypothetical protein